MRDADTEAVAPSAYRQQVERAAEAVRREADRLPTLAVLVEAGQAPLGETLEDAVRLPLSGALHTAREDAEDDALYLGTLAGVPVAVMQGRHLAGGYTAQEAAFPVRVGAALGVRGFVLLGTAAGLSPRLGAGDVMLITDHINLQGTTPLAGANEEAWGPRFPDMTAPYAADWRTAVQSRMKDTSLCQGIYAAVAGPAPATPAEQRMLQRMGADAVGRGLVPEVLAARHMDCRVLAAVTVTRSKAGDSPGTGRVEERGDATMTALVQAAVQGRPQPLDG